MDSRRFEPIVNVWNLLPSSASVRSSGSLIDSVEYLLLCHLDLFVSTKQRYDFGVHGVGSNSPQLVLDMFEASSI